MKKDILDINGISESDFFKNYDSTAFEKLSVSVDAVIFGIDGRKENDNYRKLDSQKLTVLLVKRNEHPFLGCWSLPGGFVGLNETLDEAAKRVLKNKTGLEDIYIEQLYTFGDINRDPRTRVVSSTYLSLIDLSKYELNHSEAVKECAWFVVEFLENEKLLRLTGEGETTEISVEKKIIQNGKIKEYKIYSR